MTRKSIVRAVASVEATGTQTLFCGAETRSLNTAQFTNKLSMFYSNKVARYLCLSRARARSLSGRLILLCLCRCVGASVCRCVGVSVSM